MYFLLMPSKSGPYSHHSQPMPMANVLYIKDFLRIADVNLLYEGLKCLEDQVWINSSLEHGLDQQKLDAIERVRNQILCSVKYEPKETDETSKVFLASPTDN